MSFGQARSWLSISGGALLKNLAEGMFLCWFPVAALEKLVKVFSSRP
jgi:hypothetical protein